MSKKKVLVVDSGDESRASLSQLVERFGYEASTAVSGEESVELASRLGPDLIVMSVHLPGKNGYEVTRELHEHRDLGHVPVILLTATNSREAFRAQRDWALNVGAADLLSKPVDERTLLARLELLLNAPDSVVPAPADDSASPGKHAGLSDDELDKIVKRLAQYIGPIADMLVQKLVPEVETRSELYRRLADHISDHVERERFISWAVNQV